MKQGNVRKIKISDFENAETSLDDWFFIVKIHHKSQADSGFGSIFCCRSTKLYFSKTTILDFKTAVGDVSMPQMHVVKGVKIGSAEAYVRYHNRRDLVIFELADGSDIAGVFTQNAFCADPVHVSKAHLQVGNPRYLVMNTGNANAGTGPTGMANAEPTCAKLAELAGVEAAEV